MNGGPLDEELKTLAGYGPRQAPDRLEARLREAFRRHRRARRMRAAIVTVITGAAAAACVLFFAQQPQRIELRRVSEAQALPPRPTIPVPRSAAIHKTRRKTRVNRFTATDFMALPYGDDSLVNESATIVRVELSRSALRLAGFAVPQDGADGLVQADVVLGPDGIAHAVRFVRQAN